MLANIMLHIIYIYLCFQSKTGKVGFLSWLLKTAVVFVFLSDAVCYLNWCNNIRIGFVTSLD